MANSLSLIYTAIDQVNEQLVDQPKIPKSPETPLLDSESGIDSLALVNLLVAVEQLVFDQTGTTIVIADESILTSEENPLRSIGSLAARLDSILG